ncbi:MAG: aspartate--tRNA ligase [Actinomycetota bacterium]|nr:aspartate--tRNA ligase [Actinomycetota bacterium]
MSGEVRYSRKTHYCGELSLSNVGESVVLMGWAHRRRDHGGLIFIDLRDKEGLVQTVVSPSATPESFAVAEKVRSEYVLCIKGKVRKRPEGTANPRLLTGEVEVSVEDMEILNPAKTPPFELEEGIEVAESLRLKYRYLDLRKEGMLDLLKLRHAVTETVRDFLDRQGFLEVETPILTKSTPEGARDYLVPSRLQRGHFYALPQSPQLFKQILMVAGIERYYQIARCFRDEDLRADRQPEHTQIDIEMSFVDQEDILGLIEEMMTEIFAAAGIEIKTPFERLPHEEAVDRYGTDKPDLRYGLELVDLSDLLGQTEFRVFAKVISSGGVVRGVNASGYGPAIGGVTRKRIDELVKFISEQGNGGLSWMVVEPGGKVKSPLTKFLSARETGEIIGRMKGQPGDLLLLVAADKGKACEILGMLRERLARELNLVDKGEFKFVWIIDFPLFEYDEEEKRLKPHHHPFAMPTRDSIPLLRKDPLAAKAYAYDLVVNGVEIGGGSLRIHDRKLQDKIFHLLGLSTEDIKVKFGFLLDAFQYGAPPHGGIAFGLDRLVMLIAGRNTIRDVIAFPKTQTASCLMTGAPDEVNGKQLRELHIRLK